MKKLAYLALIGIIVASSSFAQKPIIVTPKVKEVTVYITGAEMRFKESVSLKQGTNVIQFKGLSSSLNESSVQVTVGDNVEIVSVSTAARIPISQESDIVVEASDISGAALDVPSGRLQWLKELKAGEASKHRIAFSVKYPRNQKVVIRQNRIIRTPRYRN